jgi:cytochrome c
MLRFRRGIIELVAIVAVALTCFGTANAKTYGLGRVASPAEIKAWDIDVRPDGDGLPEGRGTVKAGEKIFTERCAVCHGDFGEGKDRWPPLAGGRGSLKGEAPLKTIGSYWPYLSTVFDYTRRAMPFGNAQSLTPNEVYALTAYLLFLNDVVTDESFELTNKNFSKMRLPNEKNFIADPRPDTAGVNQKAPCMNDCKKKVTITGRARVLDVTPKEQ